MLMNSIPTSDYFSNFLEWNTEQTILDFGSNWGNLLRSNKIINPNQYTGIDVYNKEWITNLLNKFNPISHPAPGGYWLQDCMILTKK